MTTTESTDRTSVEVAVRKITREDIPKVSAVMGRAFEDDPFAGWFAANDEKKPERITRFMRIALERFCIAHGDSYTTTEFQGGALWTPPGKWKLSLFDQMKMGPQMASVASWRRMPKVMGGLNAVEKFHPHEPHYYLLALGVEPTMQGRSIGSQLMAPILQKCDAEGIPAYLESSKDVNVPLYERHGFKVTKEMDVPNGGPKIWLMWRDPQ